MNKLISTLICGLFALVSVSAQEIAPKFFKLRTSTGFYLIQASSEGRDSTIIVSGSSPLADTNVALWTVSRSDRQVSGNYVYEFTNKVSGKLSVDGEVVFAVGTYENISNQLDTLGGVTGANYRGLFYAKNNAGVSLAYDPARNGVITSKSSSTTDLLVVLEKPQLRWLTVADVNENTEYTFDFLSDFEGTDNTFVFHVVSESNNQIFNIVSQASKKTLTVDSVNWTASSSINIQDQQSAFGFKLGFDKSPFKNFGLYYDPATDKVAIAVRDSSLGWDVTGKKLAANIKADVSAFVGYAKFVTDSVVTTVDAFGYMSGTLPSPKNGVVFWVDAPQKGKAIATPFGKNPYILTIVSGDADKNNKIIAAEYKSLKVSGGRANLSNTNSTIEPENQWYINESVKGGKYYYTVANRFYPDTLIKDARITNSGDAYVFGLDTVKITEVANPAGFLALSDLELASKAKVKLNIVNALGASGATLVKNDTLVVAGDKNGIEFGIKVAEGFAIDNSFPYTSLEDVKTNDVYGVYELFTVLGNDTLFLGYDKSQSILVLSKYVTAKGFVFKADAEKNGDVQYKVLPVYNSIAGEKTLRVQENGAFTAEIEFNSSLASLFTLSFGSATYEYAKIPAAHYRFLDRSATATGQDYLTRKDNGDAKFLRIGDDLRAASSASDFALWVDSAYVPETGLESLTPSYYILKGARRFADNDSLKGNFLTVKGKYDSLNDSIKFVTEETGVLVNGPKNKIKQESAFLFRLTSEENVYEIIPYKELASAKPRILALINGVVVASEDKTALPVLVTRTNDSPVSNTPVVEPTGLKVVAGAGNVLILNAAGKKVSVCNILGQIVTTTRLTSDRVTISLPKGVVIVSVENENAVKAVVK